MISDTHNHLPNVARIVELLNAAPVERVVHTGDITQAKTLHALAALDAPLFGVFGNNDVERELQYVDPARRVRSVDGLHDLLLRIGDLTLEEVEARCALPDPPAAADALVLARRALRLPVDAHTMAYALVRIGESFLYADVIAGEKPDLAKAVEILKLMLR